MVVVVVGVGRGKEGGWWWLGGGGEGELVKDSGKCGGALLWVLGEKRGRRALSRMERSIESRQIHTRNARGCQVGEVVIDEA